MNDKPTFAELRKAHEADCDAAAINSDGFIRRMLEREAALLALIDECVPYVKEIMDMYDESYPEKHKNAQALLSKLSPAEGTNNGN